MIILIACNGQPDAQKVIPSNQNDVVVSGDTVLALSNNIMVIHQDKKNNYWFGSWQDGIYKYDGNALIHFTTKDGLLDNRIDEIKEDPSGNIYLTTGKGVCLFNGHTFSTLNEKIGLNNHWKLSPNDMWFKGVGYAGFVYRYDGQHLYKLQMPKNKLGEDYVSKNPTHPTPYAVYTIYQDSKGNIWFGTGALGTMRFNGKDFDWISEKDVAEIFNDPDEGANGVRSITEDKNGDFWFNTAFRYSVYDSITSKSKSFYTRKESIGNLDGKKDSNLDEYLSVVRDDDNNLWFVTYRDGVWKYDGTNITHYAVQENEKNIFLFCIYKDNNGDLWLGTHENGAYKFNGTSFEKFIL
jgi:ligand-binding sensor domain-containing protein